MKSETPYFLRYTIKWFILDAMYKIAEYKSTLLKCFLYFWRVVCCLSMLSFIVCSALLIRNRSNEEFEKYAMNYLIIWIYIGGLARLIYCYVFDWKTHEMFMKINSIFKYEATSGIEKYTMARYVKQVYYMTKVWMLYTTFNVMFMNISSFVFSTKNERTLPFNLWYPYDWRISPYYEISIFHQTVSQLVMSSTYGNSDLLFICLTLILTGQFDLLGFEFSNVFYKVLLSHGISNEDALLFKDNCEICTGKNRRYKTHRPRTAAKDFAEIYRIIHSKKFNDDLTAGFNELIDFHEELLSMCSSLQDFFDPLQLSNFLLYVVYLTFITFLLATASNTSLLMSCGEYLIAACVQLYLITYFPQLLTTQAEQLRYHLYEFPWHLCNKKFQTVFRFVHLRTLKPIQLNIGKFGTVSLGTFLLTLRTSFSYFTVLRQLAQKQQ